MAKDVMISIGAAAKALRISVGSVRRACNNGTLAYQRTLGGRYRVSRDSVRDFLEKNTFAGTYGANQS